MWNLQLCNSVQCKLSLNKLTCFSFKSHIDRMGDNHTDVLYIIVTVITTLWSGIALSTAELNKNPSISTHQPNHGIVTANINCTYAQLLVLSAKFWTCQCWIHTFVSRQHVCGLCSSYTVDSVPLWTHILNNRNHNMSTWCRFWLQSTDRHL